ncbi:MAG: ATP-binding cassette domain-containing protein [Rhodospirillales bacterium]|nr:ATP-binding cassette domain-containing protein [Rhodospirillales bacterium]
MDGALLQAGVLHLGERNVLTLSGGERARVMLARARAAAPRFLLADEPVVGLDPAHQLRVMALLRLRAEAGMGVIVTLHDLGLAGRFCDRIVMLAASGVFGPAGRGRPRDHLPLALPARRCTPAEPSPGTQECASLFLCGSASIGDALS